MKTFGKRSLVLALFVSLAMGVFAQAPTDRNYIKQTIENWGTCRNVAITRTLGDIAIANTNDYVANYVPNKMLDKLKELNEGEHYIDDITLTEGGKWVILYDTNDAAWSAGIPEGLRQAILQFHENEYYVRSISFNDDGDWAIVAKEDVKCSTAALRKWAKDYMDSYGELWTITVGEDGNIFAVYSGGYAKKGEDIPEDLIEALGNTDKDYYRVKWAGGSWFFATEEGEYEYSM